ncbi:GNAT family N-acetyltransferase [Brevibacillus daliensis]|uniref:GNAT family N-acetyltransferase n=1 Tax=Brevibacillus daliensis TaxID=2892995 RepID=UPI001E602236|nr:GNAT family protein [Brevibacillus daliensis]
MLHIKPITLTGRLVRLEPFRKEHESGLKIAGAFPEIWTYTSVSNQTEEDWENYFTQMYQTTADGSALPFVIIEQSTGEVIGCTRLYGISHQHKQVEIGYTWLTPRVWKSSLNTECKSLLLTYCFELAGCVRVQIKTDSRNENSQRAIKRIGALYEGTLRNHMILPSGYVRDTVLFSIIDKEWEGVKAHLATLLSRK